MRLTLILTYAILTLDVIRNWNHVWVARIKEKYQYEKESAFTADARGADGDLGVGRLQNRPDQQATLDTPVPVGPEVQSTLPPVTAPTPTLPVGEMPQGLEATVNCGWTTASRAGSA